MIENANELERLREALAVARWQAEHDQASIAVLRKEAEHHRRDAQHHIRNALSVVRSIARHTIAEGETAEDYQAKLDGRLASFARLQNHVLRNAAKGVNLAVLVADELLAFNIRLGAQVHVEGDTVCLKPKPASVLGLAFHELVRMAIENGDLRDADSCIEVRWYMEVNGRGSDDLRIDWIGTSPHAAARNRAGLIFAREILESAVAYELAGRVLLDQEGDSLSCRFRLPADCLVPPLQSSGAQMP